PAVRPRPPTNGSATAAASAPAVPTAPASFRTVNTGFLWSATAVKPTMPEELRSLRPTREPRRPPHGTRRRGRVADPVRTRATGPEQVDTARRQRRSIAGPPPDRRPRGQLDASRV